MIHFTCDSCGARIILDQTRYSVVTPGQRDTHFCALKCLVSFAKTGAPVRPPKPAAVAEPKHEADGTKTCEECGRVGSRRYVETENGWRCSPTATACSGNQAAERPEPELPRPVTPHPQTSSVTARCQDCTRTWTLGGRVLDMAVDSHESKHAHIVTVYEAANA